MNRRSLFIGAAALLAAPAIIKAESLMKVAALRSNHELKSEILKAWNERDAAIVIGLPEYIQSIYPKGFLATTSWSIAFV